MCKKHFIQGVEGDLGSLLSLNEQLVSGADIMIVQSGYILATMSKPEL
jgi:hypothetical protein